jgi:hypothetical protein
VTVKIVQLDIYVLKLTPQTSLNSLAQLVAIACSELFSQHLAQQVHTATSLEESKRRIVLIAQLATIAQ